MNRDQNTKNVEQKRSEIAPATESPPAYLMRLAPHLDVEKYMVVFEARNPQEDAFFVKKDVVSFQGKRGNWEYLGYRVFEKEDAIFMEMPDLETLLGGWENLRELHPEENLPPFRMISSEGVADDLSFTEAHLAYDALLSDGKEFCHDHHSHVMSRLQSMMLNQSKSGITKILGRPYRYIYLAKESKKVEVAEEAKKYGLALGIPENYLTGL